MAEDVRRSSLGVRDYINICELPSLPSLAFRTQASLIDEIRFFIEDLPASHEESHTMPETPPSTKQVHPGRRRWRWLTPPTDCSSESANSVFSPSSPESDASFRVTAPDSHLDIIAPVPQLSIAAINTAQSLPQLP